MEKCYEYFDCKSTDCAIKTNKIEIKCWESNETLCHSEHMENIEKRVDNKCNYCIYYKLMNTP